MMKRKECLRLILSKLSVRNIIIIIGIIIIAYIFLHYLEIHYYSIGQGKIDIRNKALEIIGEETDIDESVKKVYYWMKVEKNIAFYNCGLDRIGDYNHAPWILKSRCGLCGEWALLPAALLNSVNISTRVLCDPLIIHCWNEVYNGTEWKPLETTWNPQERNGYDNITYRYRDSNQGIAIIEVMEPNGTKSISTTITKKYTDVGLMRIEVQDQYETPISNAVVLIKGDNGVIRRLTDSNGKFKIELGDHEYSVIGESGWLFLSYYDRKPVTLNPNDEKNVTLTPHSIGIPSQFFLLFDALNLFY